MRARGAEGILDGQHQQQAQRHEPVSLELHHLPRREQELIWLMYHKVQKSELPLRGGDRPAIHQF